MHDKVMARRRAAAQAGFLNDPGAALAALDDAGDWMEGPSIELGDIVISLETAGRQAQEQGHSLQQELRWLVSHGLLHLLGWDHTDDDSLAAMLALQERHHGNG